ncbi:MAG: linear amide C-N hydrolase [Acidobacteriota bacterium]
MRCIADHLMIALGAVSLLYSASPAVHAEEAGRALPPASQCTSACIVNNGFSVLGSNYDSGWTGGLIFVNKRGVKKSNAHMELRNPDGTVIRWTSKYASVTFCVGAYQFPWAGLNEKGLAFGTMALESVLDDPADPRAHMASAYWWQYVLDTCETVEDVIATDALIKIETVDHFLFTDRYGHAAVVEFQNGHMVFYKGANLHISVLTNSPYDQDRDLWDRIKHTSTTYDTLNNSQRRFCIAGDMVDEFRPTSDQRAVDYMFSILEATGWDPPVSAWSIVFDTKNLRVYFNTLGRRAIRVIDLLSFDLSCLSPPQMLSPYSSASGDVSASFANIDWNAAIENALAYMRWEGSSIPEDLLRTLIRMIRGFPCSDKKHAEGVLLAAEPDNDVANPRCAVNLKTGNVLVVWNKLDRNDASYGQVGSAMLVRSLSGTYSAVENQTLSDTGGFNGSPYPIYLPDQDKFLVVWDQTDPTRPLARSAILGRLLTGRGVPESGVLTVAAGDLRNASPQVYRRGAARSDAPRTPDATGSDLDLICYSAKVIGTSVSRAGLYIAGLDKNYRAGKADLLMKAASKKIGSVTKTETIVPVASGFEDGDAIILPIEHGLIQHDGSLLYQSKLLMIDSHNRVADSEQVGQPGAILTDLNGFEDGGGETVVLASTLAGAAITDHVLSCGPGGLSLVRSSPQEVSAVDAGYAIVAGSPTGANDAQSTAGNVGYQLFASTGGKVFSRQISDSGQTTGPLATVVKKALDVATLAGAGIVITQQAGGPVGSAGHAIVVVWDARGPSGRELRAKVVQAK